MLWWYVQTRAMAAKSQAGPVDPPQFWTSALFCVVMTVLTWLVGCYAIREFINSRARTRDMMTDLRGAVQRREP
jgi:hypothetical protein